MNNLMKLFLVTFTANVFAGAGHDHSAPGALPIALNSGVLVEAEEVGNDHSSHDHGLELFLELVFDRGSSKLSIHPMYLDHKNPKEFQTKNEAIEFQKITVKFPKSKKTEAIKLSAAKHAKKGYTYWTAQLNKKGPIKKERRFLVSAQLTHKNVKKKIKDAQVEKN